MRRCFFETVEPDSYGRAQRVFLINRDGFSLLAMGFTGHEALEWKLKYIDAFNKMEQKLVTAAKPLSIPEMLLAQAQLMVEQDKRIAAMESKVEKVGRITDAVSAIATASPGGDWQREMNGRVSALCQKYGLDYGDTRHRLYEEVEAVAHVDLKRRLDNRHKRMEKQGIPWAEIHRISRMTVIADDPKLRPVYEAQFNKLTARCLVTAQ